MKNILFQPLTLGETAPRKVLVVDSSNVAISLYLRSGFDRIHGGQYPHFQRYLRKNFFEPLNEMQDLAKIIFVFDGIAVGKSNQPVKQVISKNKNNEGGKIQAGGSIFDLLRGEDIDGDHDDDSTSEGDSDDEDSTSEEDSDDEEVVSDIEPGGGSMVMSKEKEQIQRRRKRLEEQKTVHEGKINRFSSVRMLPSNLTSYFEWCAREFEREPHSNLQFKFAQALFEADPLLAAYGKQYQRDKYNCLIISEDTDMIAFGTCPVVADCGEFYRMLSEESQGSITVNTISRMSVSDALGINSNEMPLLASIAGNDYVSRSSIKNFHEDVTSTFPDVETRIESLALFINHCREELERASDHVVTTEMLRKGVHEKVSRNGRRLEQAAKYYEMFDTEKNPLGLLDEEIEILLNGTGFGECKRVLSPTGGDFVRLYKNRGIRLDIIHSIRFNKQLSAPISNVSPRDSMRSTEFVRPLREELYALILQITLGRNAEETRMKEFAAYNRRIRSSYKTKHENQWVSATTNICSKYGISREDVMNDAVDKKLLITRIMTLNTVNSDVLKSTLENIQQEWIQFVFVAIASYKILFLQHDTSSMARKGFNDINEDQDAIEAWLTTLLADDGNKNMNFEKDDLMRYPKGNDGHYSATHVWFISTISCLLDLMRDISYALGYYDVSPILEAISKFDSHRYFQLYYKKFEGDILSPNGEELLRFVNNEIQKFGKSMPERRDEQNGFTNVRRRGNL